MQERCIKLRDLGWDVGGTLFLSTVRNDNTPKVRFSATLGQEPEVELALA